MVVELRAGGRMEDSPVTGQGITPVMLGCFRGTYRVLNDTVAFNTWDASYADRDYSLVAACPGDDGTQPVISLTLVNDVFASCGAGDAAVARARIEVRAAGGPGATGRSSRAERARRPARRPRR